MGKSMKRGFTLIELLVVLGIIGLLAAAMLGVFGAVRRQARDDRRIADLRQTQQALQLFYLKCGFYPGKFDAVTTKECTIDDANASQKNFVPNNWQELGAFLKSAAIGVESIPNDPAPGKNYDYYVQLKAQNVTPAGQCYVLRAKLETQHKSLANDLDDVDIRTKLAPPNCTSTTCKNLYPAAPLLDCEDNALNFCVGNSECFYGR